MVEPGVTKPSEFLIKLHGVLSLHHNHQVTQLKLSANLKQALTNLGGKNELIPLSVPETPDLVYYLISVVGNPHLEGQKNSHEKRSGIK